MVNRKSAMPVKQKTASPAGAFTPKPRQKPPAPQKACGTCSHLKSLDDEGGECRRYPPFAITKFDGNIADRFPNVRKADIWCGEWKA